MRACPACGTTNADAARFCVACGNSLPSGCPRCGAETPTGARFCPSCGHGLTAPPQRFDERKLVTILFADVTGSTALGERLDPERLQVILGEYFASIESAIDTWGGMVEKFIGDAVMATFGVPIVRENDAQRALHAALEILNRLESLNDRFERLHGVRLGLRIGINTGEVIAPLGERVDQLIVAGDAVNVAARLEAAAEPGTVLVGERTSIAARSAFHFSEPLTFDLKGKTEPVIARRLLGLLPGHESPTRAFESPFVGRKLEMAVLTRLAGDVAHRSEPRMAIVYGPAGIGKTRLTRELVEGTMVGARPPKVLRGRCLAVGTGITYWALAEILREVCRIGLDDNATIVKEKLTTELHRILGPMQLPPIELRETMAALAATAGIEVDDDPLRSLEPRAVSDALARAWPRFVSSLAADGPVVVIIEDLHWAGDQLVELIARTLNRSTGPVLFVATARPEFGEHHPTFGAGQEGVASIQLTPLSQDESAHLIGELLPLHHLPEALRRSILDRAEGNPFFLEEILARLIDEAVLVKDDLGWRTTDIAASFSLPDSIHALLAARIDGLSKEEKLVLQEAAVVGRVFWAAPLRLRVPDVDVGTSLLGLESRGLIVARPLSTVAGESEFIFRHALVRDVAYAGLPRSRRARAHASVAEWTEQLAADRMDEFGELVAHHYWTAIAGDEADLAWADAPDEREPLRSSAFRSLLAAGVVARRRYALTRAIELHGRARDLAVGPAEELKALSALGSDHAAAYHGDDAVAFYRQALEIARTEPDLADQRAPLCVKLARESVMKSGSFAVWPRPSDAESWIIEGLQAEPDQWARTWLLALQGGMSHLWIESDETDPKSIDERIAVSKEAVESAEQMDHRGLEVFATELLMTLLQASGHYEEALSLARRRLSIVDQLEAPSTILALLFESASTIGEIAGDWEECERLSRRAWEVARDLSSHELMHATGTLLKALFSLGRWDEADEVLRVHLDGFAAESKVTCSMVRNGPAIGALMEAYRGNLDSANSLLDLIPEVTRKTGIVDGCRALVKVMLGEIETGLTMAQLLLERQYMRTRGFMYLALLEARAALRQWDLLEQDLARAAAEAGGFVGLRTAIDRIAGLRWLALGDSGLAKTHLRRSLALAEKHGMRLDVAQAQEALAALVGPGEAGTLRAAAQSIYQQLGARPAPERMAAVEA